MRHFCQVTDRDIIIGHDADELNQKAAERFVLLANEAAVKAGPIHRGAFRRFDA